MAELVLKHVPMVLTCREEERVENLGNSLRFVDPLLQEVGTHDTLRSCLMQCARERERERERERDQVRTENIVWRKVGSSGS